MTRHRPSHRHCFVPPYLQRALGYADTLAVDESLRSARLAGPAPAATLIATPGAPAWTVHDAHSGRTLPGDPVRRAGDPDSGDPAVDEAATGIVASLALLAEVWGRDSYDGAGSPVSLSVHYGRDYANAFWDGTQLVFGDGDGVVFDRFTKPVDVLGHELAHALTEHTAGLVYADQPGALNEHVSDVVAACVKQRLLGQRPDEADWLVGQGLFRPGINARGLRDMAHPGTAYDDPRLGRDPQPAHLDDLVVTTDDHGGVHLNSGIPNRAFHLAAVAVGVADPGPGGTSWEGAGRIWYAALTGGQVGPRTDFAGFAAATIAAAGPHADAVGAAWAEVGVRPGATDPAGGVDAGAGAGSSSGGGPATGVVRVRRTGGFAGLSAEADVDLASDDPRVPELRGIAGRVDLAQAAARSPEPQPDRYVYDLDVCGECAQVGEQALTADLERLVELVLDLGHR
ncbi:Protease PrtS precursor [Nocardioides dokdonensis FR1436]|uniref:Neutral metalloproteinase n=1 Tax=Nocardioides dokdonensis FR1436 TaxID=1300347 RepID=A0A1A9GJM1_9ACTN|nr:protealysin inhibitor emfourin [Nocardioides dokdonensis]ANH38266.1 Protease PrtS precursor [Nocardioides dokdonensis FR1436]